MENLRAALKVLFELNQTGLPLTKGSFVENLRAALKGVGLTVETTLGTVFISVLPRLQQRRVSKTL